MPSISLHKNDHEQSGEIFKIPAVATYTGVHENTVWSWIKTGKLPAVRLGARIVRVRRSDLDQFIAAHLSEPTASWLTIADGR